MHRYLILMVLALSVLASVAQEASRHSYGPPNGFVPNEATAIRIAVAIWEPIYGKEAIAKQAPYVAKLESKAWIVKGTLPPHALGGVAIAEISKDDARIIRVSHGR